MSEVRIKRPQADVDPLATQGETRPQPKRGDANMQKDKICMFSPHIFPAEPQFRITEDGILRITETHNNFRILETAV